MPDAECYFAFNCKSRFEKDGLIFRYHLITVAIFQLQWIQILLQHLPRVFLLSTRGKMFHRRISLLWISGKIGTQPQKLGDNLIGAAMESDCRFSAYLSTRICAGAVLCVCFECICIVRQCWRGNFNQ